MMQGHIEKRRFGAGKYCARAHGAGTYWGEDIWQRICNKRGRWYRDISWRGPVLE
jgi:hypothetical protein